jgi:hypothetical protein
MSADGINAKVAVIYSGVEGSKDHFANHVECLQTAGSIFLRFFNQRPLRLAPLEQRIEGDNLQVMAGAMDTIEYALQTSVVMPTEMAMQLKAMLDALLPAQKKEGPQ